MNKLVVFALILLLAVTGGLAGIKVLQIKKMTGDPAAKVQPPESVATYEAKLESWQDTLKSIGSIRAAQGVLVTPEVPGAVRQIHFESGAVAKKGDVLVTLDTTSEEAQLRSIEAQLELARINLERVEKLKSDNTVSQSELDTARSNMDQFKANADAIRAAIQKKTIRAPFTGVLGLRQIDLGQYLDVGHTIVSLQALRPVFADFSLPQQELARLNTNLQVRVTTDTYPGKEFMGVLTAINPNLDANTRSIPLRATFDNQDELLRPGMFARIEVQLPQQQEVLAVPATAILSAPYGDSVFILQNNPGTNGASAGLAVRQQFVKTGQSRGDFISVVSGLKAGEVVVSAGVFKLRNGIPVVVNNSLSPEASRNPTPSDS